MRNDAIGSVGLITPKRGSGSRRSGRTACSRPAVRWRRTDLWSSWLRTLAGLRGDSTLSRRCRRPRERWHEPCGTRQSGRRGHRPVSRQAVRERRRRFRSNDGRGTTMTRDRPPEKLRIASRRSSRPESGSGPPHRAPHLQSACRGDAGRFELFAATRARLLPVVQSPPRRQLATTTARGLWSSRITRARRTNVDDRDRIRGRLKPLSRRDPLIANFFATARRASARAIGTIRRVQRHQPLQRRGRLLGRNTRLPSTSSTCSMRGTDIDYYASRLPGEPAAGVNDIHLHPARHGRFASAIVGF